MIVKGFIRDMFEIFSCFSMVFMFLHGFVFIHPWSSCFTMVPRIPWSSCSSMVLMFLHGPSHSFLHGLQVLPWSSCFSHDPSHSFLHGLQVLPWSSCFSMVLCIHSSMVFRFFHGPHVSPWSLTFFPPGSSMVFRFFHGLHVHVG